MSNIINNNSNVEVNILNEGINIVDDIAINVSNDGTMSLNGQVDNIEFYNQEDWYQVEAGDVNISETTQIGGTVTITRIDETDDEISLDLDFGNDILDMVFVEGEDGEEEPLDEDSERDEDDEDEEEEDDDY